MWVKWKLVSVYLEIVLILMQDRCIVCAKCAIGLQIVLGTPDQTRRCVGQVEAHCSLFGGSFNLDAR
jgi:hypothetical protein